MKTKEITFTLGMNELDYLVDGLNKQIKVAKRRVGTNDGSLEVSLEQDLKVLEDLRQQVVNAIGNF